MSKYTFARPSLVDLRMSSFSSPCITVVSPLSSVSPVSFIDTLPAVMHALHDIRFRFRVDNIWTSIVTNHPAVSVIVACSLNPVAADLKGPVRLSNALTRVEERLFRYIECAPPSLSLSSSIPDHASWIVTMWHFGSDSPNEYTGDEFEWEDGQNALFRIYTKDLNGVTKIRKEYPNTRFDDAIDEKLPTVIKMRTQCIQMSRR